MITDKQLALVQKYWDDYIYNHVMTEDGRDLWMIGAFKVTRKQE